MKRFVQLIRNNGDVLAIFGIMMAIFGYIIFTFPGTASDFHQQTEFIRDYVTEPDSHMFSGNFLMYFIVNLFTGFSGNMVAIMTVFSLLVAACVTIFTKYALQHEFLSVAYCPGLAGAIGVMGAYAIGWQQILKRVELSTAYMFKGTSLIFVMLLAWILFSEQITLNNIIGACVIVIGIVLYAKTDN